MIQSPRHEKEKEKEISHVSNSDVTLETPVSSFSLLMDDDTSKLPQNDLMGEESDHQIIRNIPGEDPAVVTGKYDLLDSSPTISKFESSNSVQEIQEEVKNSMSQFENINQNTVTSSPSNSHPNPQTAAISVSSTAPVPTVPMVLTEDPSSTIQLDVTSSSLTISNSFPKTSALILDKILPIINVWRSKILIIVRRT